jgi:hypothetical protein
VITRQAFGLVVDRKPDPSTANALFERCEQVTVEIDPGRPGTVVQFVRHAPSLMDAILMAVRDLDSVGLAAIGIEDDGDLLTLAAIADRVGRSREAVRLWSVGRTGPGGFPSPAYRRQQTTYYRWSQVAPWLRERLGMPVPDPEPVLAAVNLALQLRAMAPRVSRMDAVRALIAA